VKKLILAIESSCDETAAALVDEFGVVHGSKLVSQIQTHNKYGGVVPEVASRAHFQEIDSVVRNLIQECGLHHSDICKIAATMGPGLIGPLLVGVSYARGLSVAWNKPFVGVHHLRGHLASVFLERNAKMKLSDQLEQIAPAMVLLASGGHTQILSLDSNFIATGIADTSDDAAGECFDKSAKLMGLPYPGGPAIEKLARQSSGGDRAQELSAMLPRPKSEKGFSFSGLKTAIRLKVESDSALIKDPDFCWAIEDTIANVFLKALKSAYKKTTALGSIPKTLVLCGGVSANETLRMVFQNFAKSRKLDLCLPPLKYCTDNAAMIGAAAWLQSESQNILEVQARIPVSVVLEQA
jgi:N6-L-threonylcarbamoyladenine synthase